MFKKTELSVLTKLAATTIAASTLVACGGADNPTLDLTKPVIEYSELRVLNALPEGSTLTVKIGEEDEEEAVFIDLNYGDAKPYFAVPVGTGQNVIVEATMPGVYKFDPVDGVVKTWSKDAEGNYVVDAVDGDLVATSSSAVIYKGTMDFAVDEKQDLVLHGTLTVGNILDTVQDPDSTATPAPFIYDLTTNAATAFVQDSAAEGITFGHFAVGAQGTNVDIYASADCDAITETALVTNLAYGATATALVTDLPADYEEICITANGNTTALFDSGSVTLAEGMWINAIDNTSGITGASALQVAVQNGALYSLIANETDEAQIRILNPSNATVDVTYGPVSEAAIASNDSVAYQAIDSNTGASEVAYNVDVRETGAATPSTSESGVLVADGQSFTVVAYSATVAETEKVVSTTIADDSRSIATEARVRILLAGLDSHVDMFINDQTNSVDIEVTAPDEEGVEQYTVAPTISGVKSFAEKELSLAAGTYDVIITAAATEDRSVTLFSGTITVNLGDVNEYLVDDSGASLTFTAL